MPDPRVMPLLDLLAGSIANDLLREGNNQGNAAVSDRERAIFEFDLQNAAHHEAAHVIVAQFFGLCAHARLRRNTDGAEPQQKRVVGHTEFLGTPESVAERRVLGLAGVCAEYILHAGDDQDAEQLALEVEAYGMSDTDAELADGFNVGDVQRCLGLLVERWQSVEATAADLLRGVDQ